MEVLGSGIDGVVVFPPVECDKMDSIEPNDFVGKIHFRGKTFEEVKSRIDALPDEYDGILYYKENYLCDIVLPDELKIKYKNRLSNSQLILKRVHGETLQNMLDNCVINNGGCRFFELLKSSINAYYIIKELAEKITVVIVTHNMQQASRVSDYCAFFLTDGGPGYLVEADKTRKMFTTPNDSRTADYVQGKFG
jgi:hypothetical protein